MAASSVPPLQSSLSESTGSSSPRTPASASPHRHLTLPEGYVLNPPDFFQPNSQESRAYSISPRTQSVATLVLESLSLSSPASSSCSSSDSLKVFPPTPQFPEPAILSPSLPSIAPGLTSLRTPRTPRKKFKRHKKHTILSKPEKPILSPTFKTTTTYRISSSPRMMGGNSTSKNSFEECLINVVRAINKKNSTGIHFREQKEFFLSINDRKELVWKSIVHSKNKKQKATEALEHILFIAKKSYELNFCMIEEVEETKFSLPIDSDSETKLNRKSIKVFVDALLKSVFLKKLLEGSEALKKSALDFYWSIFYQRLHRDALVTLNCMESYRKTLTALNQNTHYLDPNDFERQLTEIQIIIARCNQELIALHKNFMEYLAINSHESHKKIIQYYTEQEYDNALFYAGRSIETPLREKTIHFYSLMNGLLKKCCTQILPIELSYAYHEQIKTAFKEENPHAESSIDFKTLEEILKDLPQLIQKPKPIKKGSRMRRRKLVSE